MIKQNNANFGMPPAGNGLFVVAVALLMAFFIWLFSSCATQRKAEKFLNKNPEYTANLCDSLYPIKTETVTQYVTDSSLLEQYEKEFASLYSLLDSVIIQSGTRTGDSLKTIIKERLRVVKQDAAKVRTVTVVKESTAKLQNQKNEYESKLLALSQKNLSQAIALQDCEKSQAKALQKLDKAKKQRNNLLWLVIGLLVWTLRKPIARFLFKVV